MWTSRIAFRSSSVVAGQPFSRCGNGYRSNGVKSVCLAAVLAAAIFPGSAGAAVSASTSGTLGTLTSDDAGDAIVLTAAGGLLGYTVNSAATSFDWDTSADGQQTLPSDDTVDVVVNLGGGDDSFTAGTDAARTLTVDGGAGNDTIFGSQDPDTLTGGDGDDRVIGNRGGDAMKGGAGNDLLVWNNGDGSDVMDGEAGNDGVEVNGAPTAGDQFTIKPGAVDGRVRFDRVNLGLFNLDIGTTERLNVNGLGGDDTFTGEAGLAARGILLSLDGGPGKDTLTGGDGPDLLQGGEDVDTLAGAGGDDRVVGNRGNDTMAGGDGDDTLVWNNGDNNDKADGDAGYDFMEINGAPGAGDVFTVKPENSRARFDRTNLVPFFVDISAEVLDLNTLGGDDALTVTDGSPILVDADGGSGNDSLTSGDQNDSLLGGSGNDTLTGGGGLDVIDGAEGDDTIAARDGNVDLVRCGLGTDTATGDRIDDHLGCETWDIPPAPPVVVPPAATLPSLTITSVRQRGRRVRVTITCADARCDGTLFLHTTRTTKLGRVKVVALLGRARYGLSAGARRTVTFTLPRGHRVLAGRAKTFRVQLFAATEGGRAVRRNASLKR